MAKSGKANIELPKTHLDGLNFSFSGIKTAVLNLNNNKKDINKNDLCASFEKAVTDMLLENTKQALKKTKLKKLALAGGVSANSYIRNSFLELGKKENIEIYFPKLELCTDNAAMIASAGYYNFLKGNISDLTLNASTSNNYKLTIIYVNDPENNQMIDEEGNPLDMGKSFGASIEIEHQI